MLEQAVVQSAGKRDGPRIGARAHLDRDDVEIGEPRLPEFVDASRYDAFGRPAETFEHVDARRAEAEAAQQPSDFSRRGAVRRQRQNTGAVLQKRPDKRCRTPVQRNSLDILQRPAEPGGGQREGRRARKHAVFVGIDVARNGRADAVPERVARGEHADAAPPERDEFGHRGVEGRRPRLRLAVDRIGREVEMPRAAEDELGLGDRPARTGAETGEPILADADDGQPFWRCFDYALFPR